MMLRGNLSTRPFYNERIVSLLVAMVGIVALALTVWNVTHLRDLSARRSELRAQIKADEDVAARIRQDAAAVQNSVDRSMLGALATSAREANQLIDQRTFSWTTFFGYIEETIPMGVRLVGVSPEIDRGEISITMLLLGRQVQEVDQFMVSLEETGAFYDATPTVGGKTEDGLERVTVTVKYLPPKAADREAAASPAGIEEGR
jgi:hypothetical protein